MPTQIGDEVSHYRIVDKLGEGGMGLVYRAEDTRLGRTVALKFLPHELTGDTDARSRFLREAQAASSLDHPHICTIHDVDETMDGQLFIVMAAYDGETLRERLEKGPLSLRQSLVTASQILEGLGAAHSLGIVHRDLTPANVLLAEGDRSKILDFGLAKLTGRSGLTHTGIVVGTCAYMSPEQVLGAAEIDHRSDLWAAGVVLFEMLTGQLPFAGGRKVTLHSILHESHRSLRSLRPDLPEELEQIVERALAKNPSERYASAEEMLADLRSLRGSLDDLPTTIGPRPRSARPRRRLWSLTAMGAVLLLAAALAIVLWRQLPRESRRSSPFANKEAQLLFDQARGYEARGDTKPSLQLAEQLYRKALAAEPDSPVLQAHLAALLARIQAQYPEAGRTEESRRLADQALAADPKLAPAWAARARLLLIEGDADAAQQAARRAQEVAPDQYQGYSLLGEALIAAGRVDEGIGQLYRGVEVEPDQLEPRLALASGFLGAGQYNRAAADFEEVLKYAPDSPNALGNLATIYGQTGRDDEAIVLFRRLFELQPSDRVANNLGNVLLYQHRLDEAIAAYQQANLLAPDKPAPMHGLGDAYREAGDDEQARLWYRRALEKYDLALAAGGPRARLLGQRAVVAAKLSWFGQARLNISEALELEPNNSVLLFKAAEVYALAGNAKLTYEYARRSLDAGYPAAELRRDPIFEAFQNDSNFRALLNR